MISALGSLAFAGLASAAAINHRNVVRQTTTDACEILGTAFDEQVDFESSEWVVNLPPSAALDCFKAVPVAKDRDLALLEYLRPYVSFHSTIDLLANPPETYLIPGINIWEGFNEIQAKLENDEYENQYDVMNELRAIFVVAADNHFYYSPAMFSQIRFNRKALNMTSLSVDGIQKPQVFMSSDVFHGNHGELDYRPSHVVDINGYDVNEFLVDDAAVNTANYQDPDAQYNALFHSIPKNVAGIGPTLTSSEFLIPDTYSITFHNGSTLELQNRIEFWGNFSGIRSGKDFQARFEFPEEVLSSRSVECEDRGLHGLHHNPNVHHNDDNSSGNAHSTASADDEEDVDYEVAPNGPEHYPTPYEMNPASNLATFFLEGEGYEDIAVMSVLSFVPIIEGPDFNENQFLLEAKALAEHFVGEARRTGRDKLVLDLSGNTGGYIIMAYELYRLLFPDGDFTGLDRLPANDGLDALVQADFDYFWKTTYGAMRDEDDELYTDAADWFGPYDVSGEKMTAPFINDQNVALEGGEYYDPEFDDEPLTDPPFLPENIVIVTDGVCASACTIITGLLTRNHGIRTVALGGRPNHLPMQTMGGVRGTIVHNMDSIRSWFTDMQANLEATSNSDGLSVMQQYSSAIPSAAEPPLLPLLADGAGAVNGQNGYAEDDLEGLPFHFQYEAANCRLFYTQRMMYDISEVWRRAAGVAWSGAECVHGSTASDDNTMSDDHLPYTPDVRSTASHIAAPGAL